jgi:formylglycine-generating enzyme required for sulfatase activity
MAGNVWEWVAAEYAPYGGVKGVRLHSGDKSVTRVVRGGCFIYAARDLRAAGRDGFVPRFRYVLVGFRSAREVFP